MVVSAIGAMVVVSGNVSANMSSLPPASSSPPRLMESRRSSPALEDLD